MAPLAAFLSFRFGLTDGVSAVARTWMRAFQDFGFEVTTVTGEQGSDHVIDGMGLRQTDRPVSDMADDLTAAVADADVIVVENLLTIPMNLGASAAAATALAGRKVVIHHHDPPWHRERFSGITELPLHSPGWIHVSINRVLQEQLAERRIASTLIYNGFEVPSVAELAGQSELRSNVRSDIDVDEDELLVAHPVRAIERKNIPEAIRLCEELGATYWLLGPAEEGYAAELQRVLAGAQCRTIHASRSSSDEIYAACDHVTFPSTWEGFGNPPIEASLHRRTVSVGSYPVSRELRALGFEWWNSNDPKQVADVMDARYSSAVEAIIDCNYRIARDHFSFERMSQALRDLLDSAGWLP